MLLMQLDTPRNSPLPPLPNRYFLPHAKQPVVRAEVRITLRVRSESPPIRHVQLDEKGSLIRCDSSNATSAITLRRHSVATVASQYAPISSDQLEEARCPIGPSPSDSIPLATCARDLETAATKQLPPLHPRSALPRTVAVSVNQNQTRPSRPASGNFTSTFLINTPGHTYVTRSRSFKTLRRCESTESNPPSSKPHPLTRHSSFETALRNYSNKGDNLSHIPSNRNSEEPSPRSRSFASIERFVVVNPNAKLPPAHPSTAAHQRNGVGLGMLASNKRPNSPTKLPSRQPHDFNPSPILERSAVKITMTGGGPESTSSPSQGSQFLPKEAAPATRRPVSRPIRNYARIQLPCTKASSRNNNHVMTDSLKLYEEQIFSHQISSGQRPFSWCIDVGSFDKDMGRTPDDNNSSGSPSATNSSSTVSSACSSSSSSNASHAIGPPKIGHFNRLACLRPGAVQDQAGIPINSKSRNLSPIIHAIRPGSPQVPPIHLHSPPVPPGAANRVSPHTRPGSILPGRSNTAFPPQPSESTAATSEASTPNADESDKKLLNAANASSSGTGKISCGASSASTSTSFASSLATVRPARSDSPPPPRLSSAPLPFEECSTTLATVRPDDSLPTPSLSLLPPPPPWNTDNNGSMLSSVSSSRTGGCKGVSAVRQLFVCPYCRALPTMCRCSASLNSASETGDSTAFDDSEEESESTYAFSTLDSDFIAWMRLSVKNVPSSHPCYSSRQAEALAALTRQEVANIVSIFNTNPLGLRMSLSEGTSKLVGTIRVYINLIKPVKMSLRQTMRHMPQQSPDSADVAVPDRLISFFLPRGGSRLLQLSGSTSAQEVIQCLLDRFHIQESANKFALYEHTLESQTILSRKLSPSERPLSMLMHWVRSAQAACEEFSTAIRRKRIVLQENENWEVNWSDFTPAELMNFLRILEKEEAEYRNAIYHQYGLVRQQIEQRMAQLSAQDRLLAARHSVATCPPPEQFIHTPSTSVTNTSNKMQMHHASL